MGSLLLLTLTLCVVYNIQSIFKFTLSKAIYKHANTMTRNNKYVLQFVDILVVKGIVKIYSQLF